MPRPALVLLASLAACAPTPQIDVARFEGRIPPAGPTPALAPPPAPAAPAVADPGIAGVAALRARARALSGPVIPAAERRRLDGGVPAR